MDFNVLLVDNDPVFSAGCQEYLESAGFNVYVADSIVNARDKLSTLWLHLAVVDVRLTDDNDPKDKTGLELATDMAPFLPTLILTRYTDFEDVRKAMKSLTAGKRAVVDYIDKKKPLADLLQAIRDLVGQHLDLNVDLKIDWKACDRYSLISFIEPDLTPDLIPNRSAELEDIFRKLFKQNSIRLHRQLWHDAGRIALAVFAFEDESVPESSIVVCGRREIIEEEAQRFEKSSPKVISNIGTALLRKAHTIHYAANEYLLNNSDLDSLHTLALLYQTESEKSFHITIATLFDETLRGWHRDKRIRVRNNTPGCVHTDLIRKINKEDFKSRALAIEEQVSTIGFKLRRSGGKLNVMLGGRSFSYADPLSAISRLITNYPLDLAVKAPGNIRGENILADSSGHVWLTDFAMAGLAPPGWNAANLESAVCFDWLDTPDLARRFELEISLVDSDFVNPDTRDLDSACRKSAHAIVGVRKLLTEDPHNNLAVYYYLVFLQVVERLMNFDPSSPLTSLEIARMGQIWLALAMLATKLEQLDDAEVAPVPNVIKIKDRQARIFLVGRREVSLPPKPFSILLYLYDNPDRVCTREELVEKVFMGKYDDDYLHSLIGRIRKAIGDDAKHPIHLLTIPNTGYRLILKP